MEGLILPLILMVGCGILTVVLLEIHYRLTREQYTPFEWRERILFELYLGCTGPFGFFVALLIFLSTFMEDSYE